jgi:hypothetical protein
MKMVGAAEATRLAPPVFQDIKLCRRQFWRLWRLWDRGARVVPAWPEFLAVAGSGPAAFGADASAALDGRAVGASGAATDDRHWRQNPGGVLV